MRGAYRRWVAAGAVDDAFAFYAYNDALDCEEHAAKRYARLISRAFLSRVVAPAAPCGAGANSADGTK